MNGQRKRHKVLIVDDEPGILAAVRALLEDEFDVLTASDGESGLQILRREEVAVVISDQRMRGLTGDQFLQRASAASQAVRILATAYADVEALARAVNLGRIYCYLTKPWQPKDLRTAVRRAADRYEVNMADEFALSLFGALLNAMPDRIYFKDNNGRFTCINRAQAEFLGVAHTGDAVGKTEEDFLGEGGATAADLRIMNARCPVVDALERLPDADGRMHWYSSTKVPMLDRNVATGLATVVRDVSARKRQEHSALRASEERFRAVFECGGMGIAIADREGAILEANPAIEAITGRDAAALRGKRIADLILPAEIPELTTALAGLTDGRVNSVRHECHVVTPPGQPRPIRITATDLSESGGSILLMIERLPDEFSLGLTGLAASVQEAQQPETVPAPSPDLTHH